MTNCTQVSTAMNFYQGKNPVDLVKEYGSPLYVYNEHVLRERCRELKTLVDYPGFHVNYSVKANSSLAILRIAREEGLHADALSPGEIFLNLRAGFTPEKIFFVSNNAGADEMKYAIEHGVCVSVDSLSQLERYGKLNPGGRVAVRFNPGVGAGHHKKVVTGGSETKFGVNAEYAPQVKQLLEQYRLCLTGINQHIGSLFMNDEPYIEGVKNLLDIARGFTGLEFIDLGGGFGIPYHKQAHEKRLDLAALGQRLSPLLTAFAQEYSAAGNPGPLTFTIEPGRYIVAECAVLLGTVHAVKTNGPRKFIGTDIGMNVLMRPVLYDAHHDIEVYPGLDTKASGLVPKASALGTKADASAPAARNFHPPEPVTVVGNICESGDIVARDRTLPAIREGDILGILDAGAYGFSMGSNYNSRPRPAEIMIMKDDNIKVIRKRETLEQLLVNQEP